MTRPKLGLTLSDTAETYGNARAQPLAGEAIRTCVAVSSPSPGGPRHGRASAGPVAWD